MSRMSQTSHPFVSGLPFFGLGLVMLVMTFATVVLMQRVLGRDFLGTRE